jgi:hypothetical protein
MLSGIISSVSAGGARLSADADDIIIGDSDTTFHANADNNIAIGIDALDATSGEALQNIAIGTNTLTALTTGDYNTAVGYAAGAALSDSVSGCVIIGRDSLGQGTSGVDNCISIGYRAMYGPFSTAAIADCIAIGTSAFRGTLTAAASGAIAIGTDALRANTSGANNTALGYKAGNIVTTGSGNTLIGYEADADVATDSYQLRLGHYGALRYMTAQIELDTFTNAGTDNRAATAPLLKIPQYGFLSRVTCTVITASGGTGVYNISLGTAIEAAGDSVAGQVEIIGAGASDLTGCVSRTQATDAAGDTNVDINTVRQLHIFEADLTDADNNGAWMANDMYLYVCHAGTGNGDNATNTTVRITAEYFGED